MDPRGTAHDERYAQRSSKVCCCVSRCACAGCCAGLALLAFFVGFLLAATSGLGSGISFYCYSFDATGKETASFYSDMSLGGAVNYYFWAGANASSVRTPQGLLAGDPHSYAPDYDFAAQGRTNQSTAAFGAVILGVCTSILLAFAVPAACSYGDLEADGRKRAIRPLCSIFPATGLANIILIAAAAAYMQSTLAAVRGQRVLGGQGWLQRKVSELQLLLCIRGQRTRLANRGRARGVVDGPADARDLRVCVRPRMDVQGGAAAAAATSSLTSTAGLPFVRRRSAASGDAGRRTPA